MLDDFLFRAALAGVGTAMAAGLLGDEALLDARRDGAVISCLHARDHARVYLKEVAEGVAGQRLSPEEQRAMALALGAPRPQAPLAAHPRGRDVEHAHLRGHDHTVVMGQVIAAGAQAVTVQGPSNVSAV